MPTLTMLRMRLPVKPVHSPDRIRLGELAHPPEHLVHLGDHVDAVHGQRLARGHAQGDVQHGAVLGDVDVLPAEHRVPAFGQAGLFGQVDQQPYGLVGDPVLGVVEVDPGRLRGQPFPTAGVPGEEVAQVPPRDLVMVALQRLPRLPFPQRHRWHVSSFVRPAPSAADPSTAGPTTAGTDPGKQCAPTRSFHAPVNARATASRLAVKNLAAVQRTR